METISMTLFGTNAGERSIPVKGIGNIPDKSLIRFAGHADKYIVSTCDRSEHVDEGIIYLSAPLERSVPANSLIYVETEMRLQDSGEPLAPMINLDEEFKEVKWLCERIMRSVSHIHAAMHMDTPSPQDLSPVMPTGEGVGLTRVDADVDALTKRLDALESRVDRVQESAAGGIDANHLSKRIDDLVDLATAIEGGQMKQAERIDERFTLANTRIEALENGMVHRNALNTLAERIEALEKSAMDMQGLDMATHGVFIQDIKKSLDTLSGHIRTAEKTISRLCDNAGIASPYIFPDPAP